MKKRTKAILVKPDGSMLSADPANGKYYELKELQEYVGGMIEPVYLKGDMIAIVNEEGLLLGLEPNVCASVMANQHLVGNVVFCKASMLI